MGEPSPELEQLAAVSQQPYDGDMQQLEDDSAPAIVQQSSPDSAEPDVSTESKTYQPWQFKPGNPGGPGRPKRGRAFMDELRAERDRYAAEIARHQVQQAMKERTPRFAAYLRDTLDGIPKQHLVVEREETPGDQLLQAVNRRLAALQGQTVDADSVRDITNDVT